MPNLNAITLLQMDGKLTHEEFESAVNLAIEGCKKVYDVQKEALKAKYVGIKEEAEE
jgi:exosome complex component RRP41